MIRLFGKSRIINKDERLQVLREGRILYKDGIPYKPDDETPFMISCNVQPFGGKDLLLVPEGDRLKEWFWLWTENTKDFKMQVNDRIVRSGFNYQVQSVEDWGTFTQNKIVRIDVGPNRD